MLMRNSYFVAYLARDESEPISLVGKFEPSRHHHVEIAFLRSQFPDENAADHRVVFNATGAEQLLLARR